MNIIQNKSSRPFRGGGGGMLLLEGGWNNGGVYKQSSAFSGIQSISC